MNTIGKQKRRTDKPHKTKNENTKLGKHQRKAAWKEFQDACTSEIENEIRRTKTSYLDAQDKYRRALEEAEKKAIERKQEEIAKKTKIQPNIILQIRKKAKPNNELSYNTITEDNRILTDPQETKDHIAKYFEKLYQARPRMAEYTNRTNAIVEQTTNIQNSRQQHAEDPENQQGEEDITYKELQNAIKKIKKKKSLGPDEMPIELFIEANETTRRTLLNTINKIHQDESIRTAGSKET